MAVTRVRRLAVPRAVINPLNALRALGRSSEHAPLVIPRSLVADGGEGFWSVALQVHFVQDLELRQV